MKKSSMFMFAVCAIALTACTANEEVVPESQGVNFYPAQSRATETQFQEGDKISVFAVKASGDITLKAAGNYANNVCYVYRNGVFSVSQDNPDDAAKKIMLPEDGTGLAYYAVYPYQYALIDHGTFEVQADQRTHANITASDFCTVKTSPSNDNNVYLKFWHRLSRVVIDVKGTTSTVSIRLKNVQYKASFDLNADTYVATGGKETILMGEMSTKRFEAILPPQDFVISDLIITIDGTDYPVEPAYPSVPTDYTFKSGMEYDFTIIGNKLPGPVREVNLDGDIYPWNTTDIPSDDLAEDNPTVTPNTELPNLNYTVSEEGGWYIIRLDMTGVRDPWTNDWVKLYGTLDPRQNVWLSLDNKPKGFTISNTADEAGAQERKAVDLVFLVDNSGSMSEEANTLATQVMAWAKRLSSQSGLDIQFGCVGYDGAITGAINLTTIDKLTEYLSYSSGVNRTRHFGGADASTLSSNVGPYRTGGGSSNECGAAALRFADEQFTFRTGANRVYVNFTDEPNQPNNNSAYSTEWFKDVKNWPATKGTVHTVYSENKNWTETINQNEYPWNLSTYTGGTVIYTSSSFSGVNLDDLPVTGALQNSYIIRFSNVQNLFDGQEHDVHITVKSENPNKDWVLADKIYKIIFVKP